MTVQLGPDWELQVAMLAALSASADIKTLLGDPPRLYQRVPADAVLPYVTLGEDLVLPDLADCIDGSEVYADLHIWSATDSFAECKAIAATIWAVLSAADFAMTQNTCVDFTRTPLRVLRDPDGIASHAVLTLRALTEPA